MTVRAFPESSRRSPGATMFSGILAPLDPRLVSGQVTIGANQGVLARAEAPRSGTLADLALFIITAAGNISVAIYDAATTTLTRLFTTGAIACPAAGGWNVVAASPGVTVVKGSQYYFLVSTDSSTTGFGRATMINTSAFQVPANYLTTGTKITGLDNGLHPAPATIAISSPSGTGTVMAVMARIS